MRCCKSSFLCCCGRHGTKGCCRHHHDKEESTADHQNFLLGDPSAANMDAWRTPKSGDAMSKETDQTIDIDEHARYNKNPIHDESEALLRQSILNLPSTKHSAVRALIFTLSALFGGLPEDYSALMDESFYDIGGNEENTMIAISFIQQYKYKVDVLDFLSAKSLKDIIMRMHRLGAPYTSISVPLEKRYSHRTMKSRDLDFLLNCFRESAIKGEVDPKTPEWIETWRNAIKKGNYLIFLNKSDKSPVGVALNFDLNDDGHHHLVTLIRGKPFTHLDIQKNSFKMSCKTVLIELLQFVSENLHRTGRLVQPIFFTNEGLKPQELVAVMVFMEEQNFRRIKHHKFKWIVTSRPKLLQAQIERQLMGFEVLLPEKVGEDKSILEQYRYILTAKKVD